MSRPNVFPNKGQSEPIDSKAKQEAFEAEKAAATQEIYQNAELTSPQMDAVQMMKMRTEQQINMLKQNGVVQDESLAEVKPRILTRQEQEVDAIKKRAEEQMKVRDELMAKNANQINNYQKQAEEALTTKKVYTQETPTIMPEPKYTAPKNYGESPKNIDPYIYELSQPNFNSPLDVIPLPSEGKLYPSKKANVKVSFMTTSDENILTSPNLLQSGQFLEILINRKLLEPDLRYSDLHIGDRNAIMLWLRATGYGEMYPVTLLDEDGETFETEINLNELKYKPLGAEPDAEGLFDYQFPVSKMHIKFKLLTCGDVDEIEKRVDNEKEKGSPIDNSSTYFLEKSIIEVNGSRDRNMIRDFANSIRIIDARELKNYIEKIESGVDLEVTVGTPRGGSISSFLPFNVKFFWPNFRV
jgi:hypothetical protein